ncbi:hypothetical protein AF50_02450, partial [Klebsiella pneumoniae MGH 64]
RVARCLREAQAAGAIASDASPQALAQVFWIGRKPRCYPRRFPNG